MSHMNNFHHELYENVSCDFAVLMMNEFSGYKSKIPIIHWKIDFGPCSLTSKTMILQIVTDFRSTRKESIFENFQTPPYVSERGQLDLRSTRRGFYRLDHYVFKSIPVWKFNKFLVCKTLEPHDPPPSYDRLRVGRRD